MLNPSISSIALPTGTLFACRAWLHERGVSYWVDDAAWEPDASCAVTRDAGGYRVVAVAACDGTCQACQEGSHG